MLTLVELFDPEMTENAASPLLLQPDKVIYLGCRDRMLPCHRRNLSRFLRAVGLCCRAEFVTVSRYDKEDIEAAIRKILRENEGCVFDITGGGELALVVMGELSRSMGISMHQVCPETGRILAVTGPAPAAAARPALTVAEQILLYGGKVLSSEDAGWEDGPEFRSAVTALWAFVRENPEIMNRHGSFFGTADPLGGLSAFWARKPGRRSPDMGFLRALLRQGLLSALEQEHDGIRFTYRDKNLRRLLTKAGNLLEVYIWLAARESGAFHDVRQGVILDWDGSESGPSETKNEVDVLVTRGLVSGFISCKNGSAKKDALYELETVAERFGGRYAKRILAVTAMEKSPSAAAYLRTRAEDSGILLLEDVYKMELRQVSDRLTEIFR